VDSLHNTKLRGSKPVILDQAFTYKNTVKLALNLSICPPVFGERKEM